MKRVQRAATLLVLLALFISPTIFYAQDQEPPADAVTITGSGIVADILSALAEGTDDAPALDISITGTTGGLTAFCQGDADITGAVRPISLDEDALCQENEIEYAEFLAGYNILAIIAHPDLTFTECLAPDTVNALFAPSAQGIVTNWTDTGLEDAADEALTVFLPPDDTAIFALLDNIAGGVGLRRDATVEASQAAIIEAVSSTPGAVGVVSLNALSDEQDVSLLQIQNAIGECVEPSVEAVESRRYDNVERLLVYATRDSLEQPATASLLSLLADPDAASQIEAAGYTAPSEDVYAVNQAVLAGETGRQFTIDIATFEIPADLFGTVSVGGAAVLFDYLNQATTLFGFAYPGVTINLDLAGEPRGVRQLCNGEINLLGAQNELSTEALENCAANNITPVTFELGREAVVMLANADDEHLQCLTVEQTLAIWSASEEPVTTWDQVSDDFPADPLILVAPPLGSQRYTGLLLRSPDGFDRPQRPDVAESRADPLYRAAAVSNASGALTYMNWAEYQRVLDNEQEGYQLVAIDAGSGCIAPAEETITDDSYPYTAQRLLIASLPSLARAEVQSVLWYMFADENYDFFQSGGLSGPAFVDLPAIRERLQALFTEALALEIDPAPEFDIDPEATDEPDADISEESEPDADEVEDTGDAEATPETSD